MSPVETLAFLVRGIGGRAKRSIPLVSIQTEGERAALPKRAAQYDGLRFAQLAYHGPLAVP